MTKLTKFKLIPLLFLNLKAGGDQSIPIDQAYAYRKSQYERHPWLNKDPGTKEEYFRERGANPDGTKNTNDPRWNGR